MVEIGTMESMESMDMKVVNAIASTDESSKDREDPSTESEDTRDLPKGIIIRGKEFNPTPNEIDLYGNIQLHHSVSHVDPDESRVKNLLIEYPEGASKQNQFGRLPLHYVLDRATTSLPVAKMLIKSYPQGANVEDNEGNTPYDLALHWHHSKKMLRLLLKCDKYQDIEMWRRLEFGYMYGLCFCLCCWRRPRQGVNESDGSNLIDGDDDQKLVKKQNSFEGYPEDTIIPFSS